MNDDRGTAVAPATRPGFLAPPADAVPTDRCVRCGATTPAGVALCEEHNPGRIGGPSATQMHATILIGVIAGVLGFLILMRIAAGPSDPFRVELLGAGVHPSGGVALGFSIVNEAESSRVADCRVSRDGVPRPDDLVFRTQRLPAGEMVLIERVVPPARTESVPYDVERMTVACT